MPLLTMFDKQIHCGWASATSAVDGRTAPARGGSRRPLGVMDLTTHERLPRGAAGAYEIFQKKEDGCIKVVLKP